MRAAHDYEWDAAEVRDARRGGAATDFISSEQVVDYFAGEEELLLGAPGPTIQGKPKVSDVDQVRRRWVVERKFPASERAAKWTLVYATRSLSTAYLATDLLIVEPVGLKWRVKSEGISETSVLPAWVSELCSTRSESTTRAKLRRLIVEMRALLVCRDFAVIDTILRNANLSEFSADIVMGLFRASAVARPHLPSWTKGVSRAVDELKRRDLPAESIMAGLMDVADEAGDNIPAR